MHREAEGRGPETEDAGAASVGSPKTKKRCVCGRKDLRLDLKVYTTWIPTQQGVDGRPTPKSSKKIQETTARPSSTPPHTIPHATRHGGHHHHHHHKGQTGSSL